jgi:Flp pilus assembly protein TadG
MRIIHRSRQRTRTDERGAIAILAAALMVVLLIASAFTVDFGVAYVSKRQLQTAADSAALAAAAVYSKYPGTCAQLTANVAYKSEAQTVANSYRTKNRSGSTGTTITPSCNAQGELVVGYSATASTATFFGVIIGTNSITTSRTASAQVDVPNAVNHGIRPYALCSADVPTGPTPSGVVEIKPPGQAHGGSLCADAQAGGNWWFVTCDIPGGGQSDGSPKNMGTAIEQGCTNTIKIVTPQNKTTPATLSTSMTVNCSAGKPATSSCLDGDTGNSSLKNKDGYEAWDTILGKKIMLPVFCSTPTCNPDTVSGTGTNTRYPVYSIAGVVVCGYHIYDKNSKVSNTGDCAGNTFTSAYVSGQDKKDVYFYLKFTQVLTSSDQSASDCALGTTCDGGLRRVRLSD